MNIFAIVEADYASNVERLLMDSTDFKYTVDCLQEAYTDEAVLYLQVWRDNGIQKVFGYKGTLELLADYEGDGE